VYEGAIAAWQGEITRETWLKPLIQYADKVNFPIHRPITLLTDEENQILWNGCAHFQGINQFFEYLENNLQKIQNRVMLSRFKSKQECPDCLGSRIRKDAHYVKINNNSIGDLLKLSTDKLFEFVGNICLNEHEAKVAKIILTEISNRLHYLREVGLGYLNMNRLTSTLSGGEFQRIKLATSLGSALVGSMYILDEPSIGLHPRDTANLVRVLKKLRDLGNTVIVVEHEAEVMRAADFIADIGPDAGENGGYLVAAGTAEEVMKNENSYTGKFLKGDLFIPIPAQRRVCNTFIEIKGASENNLKNINVKFPLNALTVVTGVSGSGKSTLVKKILYHALCRKLGLTTDEAGDFSVLSGAFGKLTSVEMIDQNPIGRSSRSNPITYLKAYDHIRSLYAQQPNAAANGLDAGSFSFNVEGGRCEPCQGEGYITIEMQFMADVRLLCEHCKGKRFQNHVLEVKYAEKNISEVLEMTVDDALHFFSDKSNIKDKLQALQDTGLGYVRLGQSSATLSGGEAQRLKLANFLAKGESLNKRILFVFDEPTTGLHFKDIEKLLKAINALIDNGHSVIIIEHNLEVIKTADYIIDLGPDGGENGGNLCFEGTPEEMLALADSNLTAKYLAREMKRKNQTV
jgi:excinuclease ABC subunit A